MARAEKKSFWKMLRVAILLIVLATVALNAWRDQNQDWSQPIFVTLYPVNADQSSASASYIQKLNTTDFSVIEEYLQQQSQRYRTQPVQFYFRLAQPVNKLPPAIPTDSSIFAVMWWSLKFRYYAWRQQQDLGYQPSVSLFLSYYDAKTHPVLKHSTALENGRIGVVNLFASTQQAPQNKIVITHEALHAFGAKDKYNLATGEPIDPIGYAEPNLSPRYPQKKAEIMAVAIPLSATKSKMAESLRYTLVSELTAKELGWVRSDK